MNSLWKEIENLVAEGIEGPKIDFKLLLDIDNKANKAEFAKDIAAIANTGEEKGYIIFGVLERSERKDGGEYVIGINHSNPDQKQRQMDQILHIWVDPPPAIRFTIITHPKFNKPMGVIEILPSQNRPHLLKRDSGDNITQNMIYVRRGTATYTACRSEILDMAEYFWRPKIGGEREEVRKLLTYQLDSIRDDERENYNIAQQAGKKLYHTLPKVKRDKILKDILVNRPEYFSDWFREE